MTTNLLSVIEQQHETLKAIDRADIGLGEYVNRNLTTLQQMTDAAIAAGQQALEQTQGEDDYKRGFADGMKEAPTGEYWIRAIDEAMVGAHLGVADMADDYGTAKKKLNDLICWSVQVDRDLSHPQAIEPQALEQTQGEADPDDSLLICASDLEHSAIYDNHSEMQSCIRAVAQRIKSLTTHPQATEPALPTAAMPVGELTDEQIDVIAGGKVDYFDRRVFARAILAAARTQPVREPMQYCRECMRPMQNDGTCGHGIK